MAYNTWKESKYDLNLIPNELPKTKFDAWLDKDDIPKSRKDLKGVEGMMFGIRFRSKK